MCPTLLTFDSKNPSDACLYDTLIYECDVHLCLEVIQTTLLGHAAHEAQRLKTCDIGAQAQVGATRKRHEERAWEV